MHIFLYRLCTDHAKIGSNLINQLFKSGRAIGCPDMKVSFVRGKLMIAADLANPAPKSVPHQITRD